jgi:hypothetical protein
MTSNIIRIEATPSTWNLHKYLVIIANKNKDAVQKAIKQIFRKIEGKLENQPKNFPIPRCGGRETNDSQMIIAQNGSDEEKTLSSYMATLKTLAVAQNPQDAGPTEPPKRHRRYTISYASATKSGLIEKFSSVSPMSNDTLVYQQPDMTIKNTSTSETGKRQVSWDENTIDTGRSPGSSLSRSITNSKIQTIKRDIDAELKELKENLEDRMAKQEEQMSEIVQVIKQMNENIEQRMAHAVLAALIEEKEKVQELTHGQANDASMAPLADENGNLPFYSGKVQLGGPLHWLHHVKVTVQKMAGVIDMIADHIVQKDPTAKQIFFTDEDSDSSKPPAIKSMDPTPTEEEDLHQSIDSNVPMNMIREYSGAKRLLR